VFNPKIKVALKDRTPLERDKVFYSAVPCRGLNNRMWRKYLGCN